MKTSILSLLLFACLFGCDKTSSPDGRSQLRDEDLAKKIDRLNNKQIIILDSLQVLDKKIEALKRPNN